jgi:hypothetical protein
MLSNFFKQFSILALLFVSAACLAADDSASNTATQASLFTQAASDEQLQSLANRLSLGEATRGSFEQQRHLKVLKKPLFSQGQFIFSPQAGLVWQQTRPFTNTMILADNQLIQQNSQGQIQVSTTNNHALAEKLPQLFHAILTGDIAQLSGEFTLYFAEQDKLWTLGLSPQDPALKSAMGYMIIAGDQHITSLTMLSQLPATDTEQDYTQILFIQVEQGPLSAKELAWFSLVTQSVEAKPIETESLDAKSVEAKQVNTLPAQDKPVKP